MKSVRYLALLCAILWLIQNACNNIKNELSYVRQDPDCPVVDSLSPASAHFDDTVTVIGRNFYSRDLKQYELYIDGSRIDNAYLIDVIDNNTLRFRVPPHAADGKVQVKLSYLSCSDLTDIGPEFTYLYTFSGPSLFAGSADMSTGCESCLSIPTGIEVDENGDVWVADKGHNCIKKYDRTGNLIREVGESTSMPPDCTSSCTDPPPTGTQDQSVCFSLPENLSKGPGGDIFVTQPGLNTIARIKTEGMAIYTGICGKSFPVNDGNCNAANYSLPNDITWDNSLKTIYIVDGSRVRTIDSSCIVKTLTFPDGQKEKALSVEIGHLKSGLRPYVLISRNNSYSLVYIDKSGDLIPIKLAQNPFNNPYSLAADDRGNIFVCDSGNNQVFIVYSNGNVQAIPGLGLKKPRGLALNETYEVLYISDTQNNIVKKVNLK